MISSIRARRLGGHLHAVLPVAGLLLLLLAAAPSGAAAALLRPLALTRVDVCGTTTGNTTWTADKVYVLTCDYTIALGHTLTIRPGTVVKVDAGRQVAVYGTLAAVGTATSKVVFTSLNDDRYGGDTNGSTAAPAREDWTALTFYEGSSATLTHAIIAYGGYAGYPLVWSASSNIALSWATLERSAGDGLHTVVDGVRATYSNFLDIAARAVAASNEELIVHAANNYWASSYGPIRDVAAPGGRKQ